MIEKKEVDKPSITALSVASAFQRMLASEYDYLFSNNELGLITHIINAGITPLPSLSMNGFFARTLASLPYEAQTIFFDLAVEQYYDEYILLRKYMVKDRINSAIKDGATQIVFLSGGYDVRPFISAQEHPKVNFYELDRGITRDTKIHAMNTAPFENLEFPSIHIKTLSKCATQVNENLFYLECDFTKDDMSETVAKYGFNKELKSLIICEGLTMYLGEQANKEVLHYANKLMGHPDSELLLGYTTDLENESNFAVIAKGKSNESCKFSLSPQNALSFTADSEMNIMEKKAITDLFRFLKDENCNEFFKDLENHKGREWYYVMKKQNGVLDSTKKIEDVPDMNIDIQVNAEREESFCVQM